MYIFLQFVFIFFIGCSVGWVLELIFRKFYSGKWVNPGFLIGPYLPIYGFGLVSLTLIYNLFKDSNLNCIVIILLMGLIMTLIELIGGLIGLKNNVKLWDYTDMKYNYKGILCPQFSAIWTALGALYYFFLASHIMNALDWFSNNLTFSYLLGIFSGCMIIDTIYSTRLYNKIKQYAFDNNIIIKYELLKMHIKDIQKQAKEKYSFLNPFRQTKSLIEYLVDYTKKIKK